MGSALRGFCNARHVSIAVQITLLFVYIPTYGSVADAIKNCSSVTDRFENQNSKEHDGMIAGYLNYQPQGTGYPSYEPDSGVRNTRALQLAEACLIYGRR